MKTQNHSHRRGFTLVELLVVIAIIATLAAVAFSVGPKMLRKSKQATSVQNSRQIGILLASYASEHNNRLPAVQVVRSDEDPADWPKWQYWHHVAMLETNPGLTISQLMSDDWWKREDPVLLNPLWPKSQITHYWTGYAMNLRIAHNLKLSSQGKPVFPSAKQTKRYMPRLAAINEPARTPLVAASYNWAFHRKL